MPALGDLFDMFTFRGARINNTDLIRSTIADSEGGPQARCASGRPRAIGELSPARELSAGRNVLITAK
jgi:hypothetical protein